MPQTLAHLVEPLPTVSHFTVFSELAQIFINQPELNAVLVTPARNDGPYGLLCRAKALRPTLLFPDEEVARFSDYDVLSCTETSTLNDFQHVERQVLERGLIHYDGVRATGYVSPLKLAQYHADQRARFKGERDDARTALSHALEQRLHQLADMGHELRSPLNSIIGYSDMMRSELKGPLGAPDYKSYAGAIYHAGEHLLNIINAVLDMAKLDARALQLNEGRVSLQHICLSAKDMMGLVAEQAEISVQIQIPAALPDIFVDPQLFRQILLNLLSNAVKFSSKGSAVRIQAKLDKRGFLRLAVIDAGPGISAEDIKRVMKPFQQTKAHRGQGTGLGLPLVNSLCALHDCRFQLLSQEGKGTRAVVTIPPGRVHGCRPSGQGEFIFTCGAHQA